MGKNTENIRQMLKGEHKTQNKTIIGFQEGKKTSKDYNVGDEWEEIDKFGNVIKCKKEQGYITRTSPQALIKRQIQDILNTFTKCPKEKCDADPYSRINVKTRIKTGMCIDCLCRYEDDIRLAGKWKEYEQDKMLEKANSIFTASDQVLEEILTPIRKGYYEEVHEDGTITKHSINPGVAEQLIKEYTNYKETVFDEIRR